MTDTLIEFIKAIQATGRCNMFDTVAVQRAAYENELFELVLFIEEHRAEYARFILSGKCE